MPYNTTINIPDNHSSSDSDIDSDNHYTSDSFRIYDFKVRICPRTRTHDWTECPFAHPGEKARRRDPRIYHYSGIPCPDFKTGRCERGDACEFAHGVFECWLHPTRYRTQPCKDGVMCRRRVCFFAHTQRQLRVVSPKGRCDLRSPTSILRSGSIFDDELMMAVMMRRMDLCGDVIERRIDCEFVDDDGGFDESDFGWISELVK